MLHLQHFHNIFSTNFRLQVIISSNLNLLLKLLFFSLVTANNNLLLRLYYERIMNIAFFI